MRTLLTGDLLRHEAESDMTYVIDSDRCIACGWCRDTCPTQAATGVFKQRVTYSIEVAMCIDCDLCAQVCPSDCISHRPELQPTPAQLDTALARAKSTNQRYDQAARWKRQPPWFRGHRLSNDRPAI